MIGIISSFLLNALPLIILIIPIPFIWKKVIGKIYFRIVIGIVVFYLIYWVLPIIFQIRIQPKELSGGNNTLGIGFIIAHFINLITIFASYPLITLPFIFILTIIGEIFSYSITQITTIILVEMFLTMTLVHIYFNFKGNI